MSYRMSDMKWSNLRSKKCPKDGTPLQEREAGFECPFVDRYYESPCGFFITHAKRDTLLADLKLKRVNPARTTAGKFS